MLKLALEVEFTKLEIVCDNRPGGNIIIDLVRHKT